MAQIDPSIAMGFRPPQIESPINQMAAMAQLQGLRQQQEQNALKLQEYQQLQQEQNALAKLYGDRSLEFGSDEFLRRAAIAAPRSFEGIATRAAQRENLLAQREAREAETQKREFEAKKLEGQLSKENYQTAVGEILGYESLTDVVNDIYQKEVAGEITPQQAAALRAKLPKDDAGLDSWRITTMRGLLPPKEQLADIRTTVEAQQKAQDRTAPKPEKVDLGGKTVILDMNPLSDTYKQEIGSFEKTAGPAPVTESNVARLQRERAVIFAANPNDPRIKQIDEAIGKETGTTMTAEQKSQAQDRDARRALERERLNLERYKASKGDGSGRGPGPGTKLEKGEIWNEAEQRIETVPGSKLNIAQSNAHGKDRSSLVAVETKTNSAINKIDEILDPKNQAGFDANFSGMVPYGGFVTGRFAPDSRRKIESLKADMKSAGLELIRQGGSIGQITEREWPILEAMIAGISPEMTPEAARAEFTKVRAYMNRLKDNAKDAYQTEWGDTQYFKPAPGSTPSSKLTPADKQALAWANSNPKDPRAAQIKQRLGVK